MKKLIILINCIWLSGLVNALSMQNNTSNDIAINSNKIFTLKKHHQIKLLDHGYYQIDSLSGRSLGVLTTDSDYIGLHNKSASVLTCGKTKWYVGYLRPESELELKTFTCNSKIIVISDNHKP